MLRIRPQLCRLVRREGGEALATVREEGEKERERGGEGEEKRRRGRGGRGGRKVRKFMTRHYSITSIAYQLR